MLTAVKNYADGLFHLFFPHHCIGCAAPLPKQHLLCAPCLASLPHTNLFSVAGNPLERQFYGRVELANAGAAFYFTKHSTMQQLFFALKYKGVKEVGEFLGIEIAKEISKSPLYRDVDLIVPLPLNIRKERIRGYNQAELIARSLARQLGIPMQTHAIERTTFTKTQTHKDRLHRWQTMERVFVVKNADALANKHILLIDDIVTTGATLESCALAIKAVEGTTVSLACAAWTV